MIFLKKLAALLAVVLVAAVMTGCARMGSMADGNGIPKGQVRLGVDELEARGFDVLAGKRVGLITNHTGLNRAAKPTIDVLMEAPEVNLVALYSPEHGIRGTADEKVGDGIDEKTGLPIFSLYGETRKPTPEMLEGVDVLVFDIQDIGTRFYTYIGTMALAMEAAAEEGKEFVVLDRPNPIGGHKVEGIVADPEVTGGITAIYPIPTRHGMTVGELAKMFNAEHNINVPLTVVPVANWARDMYYDETGLLWVNPSPNMKTLNGAILYPGFGTAETTWISCGRGTDRPFEMYGAPYFDAEKLAADMNALDIPGLHFVPYEFTPTAQYHKHRGELCHGIFVNIYDRDAFNCIEAGLHMVKAMHRNNPEEYKVLGGFKVHTGSPQTWDMLIEQDMEPAAVLEHFRPGQEQFLQTRHKYLLYK